MNEIEELIAYFETNSMPPMPIKVNAYSIFYEDHFQSVIDMAKAGSQFAQFRLILLRDWLENQNNGS